MKRQQNLVKLLDELDEFSYHHVIAETKEIALVFYTGPDCGACHHLRNVLQVCQVKYNDFSVFEVDAAKAMGLVNEFNVFHLPSMFLYRDGVYHCELHAEPIPERIYHAVEVALGLPAEEEP